ncbi:MAG: hypothetical protein ACKPKO_42250, partial [Candidatus Fonsibacter sp.]
MAALEELPSGELLRLRLRYLKERRQAALRAGPIGTEDLLRCEADVAEILAESRRLRQWPVRVQAAADAVKAVEKRVDTLRTDYELSKSTTAALEAELSVAEAELLEAKGELERAQ